MTMTNVSIHAPHEGERLNINFTSFIQFGFNPRSPRGGATWKKYKNVQEYVVSIHAPHEGERLLTAFDINRE